MRTSHTLRFPFAVLLVAFVFGAPSVGAAKPTVKQGSSLANVEVLIVRHAERNGIEDELTPRGVERSKAYVGYFENLKLDGRSIHLTHLIAEKSKRTTLTLKPLSDDSHMALDQRFSTKQGDELAEDLKTHSYGNENLDLLAPQQDPRFDRGVGGDPKLLIPDGKWPQGTYDWVVDLRFDADGKLKPSGEKLIHEHLMSWDSK